MVRGTNLSVVSSAPQGARLLQRAPGVGQLTTGRGTSLVGAWLRCQLRIITLGSVPPYVADHPLAV